jgi:hypothetical protein
MRRLILALAALAAAPALAGAMPLQPLPPVGSGYVVPVQGCGPPVRGVYTDALSGVQTEYWRPRPCPPGYGRGGWDERPRRRYYDEGGYRPPPRRYYEDDRSYRPRRPPPPGWERDPYTGRDMRILR